MLSRVADSLYWMSRYLERAEHTTRVLDVNLNLMLDESPASAGRRWQRVLLALGSPKHVRWSGNLDALTRTLTFDTANKASILSCIVAARENARNVREQIASEMWSRLNSLYLQVTRLHTPATLQMTSDLHAEALLARPAADPTPETDLPTEFLQQVMEAVQQFQGITDSTMSHGEGWQFIQVGRFLERASATAMILEAYFPDLWRAPTTPPGPHPGEHAAPDHLTDALLGPAHYLDSMGLLRSCTAFEAYCKVYTADLTPEQILEFLLLDPHFPHSLRFAIDSLQSALDAIQIESGKLRAEPIRRRAGRLQATLSYSSIDDILAGDVLAYLANIKSECRLLHNTIYELYVDYSIQSALAG